MHCRHIKSALQVDAKHNNNAHTHPPHPPHPCISYHRRPPFISSTCRGDLCTKCHRKRTRTPTKKYDSRDYGFGEDDQSSIGPTTEDSSVAQTTGTGKAGVAEGEEAEPGREAGAGAENIAAATAGTGGVDDPNSISSYADDFADDDSVPPGQQVKLLSSSDKPDSSAETPNAANDGNGNGDPAGQPEGGEPSIGRSSGAVGASSSPTPLSESESKAREPVTGGSTGGSNRKHSRRSSVAREDRDRRRSSTSGKKNGADKDGAAVGSSSMDGSSGAAARAYGEKLSPSMRELEDRLREADLENGRLREAMKKSVAATPGEDDGGRNELEILKSQVEAAR